MRVAVIADPIIPVPPVKYGGAERNAAFLCEGLVARGHDVRLVAGPGSTARGRLVLHRPADPRSRRSRAYRKLLFQAISLREALQADVVHNYGRLDYLWALMRTRVPLVLRFGNPIREEDIRWLASFRRPRTMLVSISDHQRAHVGAYGPWRTIYNAQPLDRLPFCERPDDPPYLAFLGRLTENKGVHVALDVAEAVGLPLRLGGPVTDERGARDYFARQVEPRLGPRAQWLGELDDAGKARLLGGAVATLFPILWDEPAGNVMVESLACGTPVVAFRRASTPEYVTHGRTGYLCDTAREMIDAARRAGALDRAACRRECEERFGTDRMVEEYLALYRELGA